MRADVSEVCGLQKHRPANITSGNAWWYRMVLFLLFMMVSGVGWAGVTGTLSGRVVKKESARPLAGVNVYIPGTYLGASTDENGKYLITNIPAGRYEIHASLIGYRKVIKTDAVILTDLRTRINFSMEESALEGEPVVITAESPMIRKDITGTTHFVSSREIEYLPVQSFQEIVNIQPGVAAGHIRGGRKSEVLYLVDGIPVMEAIEGKVGSELPNSSIIEMTVQTGGFNAEYGNAMSGVVNILTREGTGEFKAKGEFELNYLGRNPMPFSEDRAALDPLGEVAISGPLISGKSGYYLSANFLKPYSRWKDEQYGNRMIVLNSRESYNYNLNTKLTFHPHSSVKLTAQGLLSMWNWREYDHKWKYNLTGLPLRTKKSYRMSLTGVHTLSPRTFYEVRLSTYNVLKSILGNSFRDVPDLSFYDYNGDGFENLNDWKGFVKSGHLPWWMDHEEIQSLAMVDFTSQVNDHHQIKTGMHFTYYDLYRKNVQAKYIEGYDPKFPQYITYNTEFDYYPWRGAWYLQDKIDYTSVVYNFGIRVDYFHPRSSRPALEERLVGERSEWILNHERREPASPKVQVSPRMGVALPVTATDVLHVNYGHFFQMPQFEFLYANTNLNTAQGFSPLGDPDLKPAKTIMYEVSYKSQITPSIMIDGTIFNKDVSNLVDANTFKNKTEGDIYRSSGFSRFVNLSLANIRGFELYLKRSHSRYLSGKISYTFMVAKGTGSSALEKFEWTQKRYSVPTDQYYLSWDQRHTVVVNLDLRRPDIGGLNILWRWNSPLPYTRDIGIGTEPNNRRMESTSTLDIRMNKSFTIGSVTPYLYLEVLNLFDRENVLWVDDLGRAGGEFRDPGAIDMYRRIRLGAGVNL